MKSWGEIFMLDWSYGEILADFYKNGFFDVSLSIQYNKSLMWKCSKFTFIYFLDNNYDI